MAIRITPSTGANDSYELFKGRVLKVEERTETRNHSDTLDYTDNRSTHCVYALVWLGTYGVPPRDAHFAGRTLVQHESLGKPGHVSEFDAKPRDVEFFEQFGWVDCTNLFTWRGSDHRIPNVDASPDGDPMMWANYIAYEAYLRSVAEKARREAEAAAAAAAEEAAKATAKRATKEAKSLAQKAEVEARMVHTPAKGTTATVNGFTGKVFWKGVKLYRGKWRGTVALKDAKDNVSWIDVGHWVPETPAAPKKKGAKR